MHLFRFAPALTLFATSLGAFVACKDVDPPTAPVNEEEVITTVEVAYGGQTGVGTMTYRDIDGPGGAAPTITGATLAANSTYTLTVSFFNDSATPREDITMEVREEGTEHQVFYLVDGFAAAFAYTDTDTGGRPLGLTATITTGDAGEGSLTVVLRHEPNKDAAGVADGDISKAGGETDVEVAFPVTVE